MKNKANSLCATLCLGLLTATAVVTLSGCAGDRYTRSTGEHIDDESVQMRVNSALHNNSDYKFDGVKVAVFKGTVQLSGFVDLSAQKSTAENIAKQVVGVKDVANSITVKGGAASNGGEFVDDKTLAERVRNALHDNPGYKFSEVNVASREGTVQLSGFVDSSDQKSRAAEITRQVQGVNNVANNITVKP